MQIWQQRDLIVRMIAIGVMCLLSCHMQCGQWAKCRIASKSGRDWCRVGLMPIRFCTELPMCRVASSQVVQVPISIRGRVSQGPSWLGTFCDYIKVSMEINAQKLQNTDSGHHWNIDFENNNAKHRFHYVHAILNVFCIYNTVAITAYGWGLSLKMGKTVSM